MAGNATDYLETRLLQHSLRVAAFTMPPALFCALCTSLPTDATPGGEVTGGGYARQPFTFSVTGNQASNATTQDFPAATSPWGTVGWTELWDAVTGGNRLYWFPLVDPADLVTPITKTIATGDIMRIPAGGMVITAD